MKIMNFNRRIILSISFVFAFAIFSPLVFACINPSMKTESGTPINSFGGIFEVNGSKYPGADVLQITYNLRVGNNNNQGMIVALEVDSVVKEYASVSSVFVPANSEVNMPMQVWVGGIDRLVRLDVLFQCDDGNPQFLTPVIYMVIWGKGISPPPNITCSAPRSLSGCYSGMYRSYSCSGNELTYKSSCTKYCCEKYGGEGATCSSDRSTCFSLNNLPPPTEGKIALVCNKDDCNGGIEKKIWFMLRMKGWDVVGKSYKTWTESDLSQYDIIACSDGNPCDFDFNSVLYNMHFKYRKPFLEIPDSNGAKAAYAFDYVSSSTGKTVRDPQLSYEQDVITEGIPDGIAINGERFAGIEGKNFKNPSKPLANSTEDKHTLIFKVKENVAHGRFAYLGLFMKSGASDMTLDGERILNRTLKWLKCGDACFGGTNDDQPRKGTIGFICSSDKCSSRNEIQLIKFLREIGYNVDSFSLKGWAGKDLSQYNLFVCSSSRTCKLDSTSNIYSAHVNSGKGFVEMTDTSKAYAAFAFGHANSYSTKRKSSVNITSNITDPITSGLPTPIIVSKRSKGMAGLESLISGVSDLAHVFYRGTDTGLSTMFRVDQSGSHGRYIFVGWTGRFDIDNLTDNGKIVLTRVINWANCGNISC